MGDQAFKVECDQVTEHFECHVAGLGICKAQSVGGRITEILEEDKGGSEAVQLLRVLLPPSPPAVIQPPLSVWWWGWGW